MSDRLKGSSKRPPIPEQSQTGESIGKAKKTEESTPKEKLQVAAKVKRPEKNKSIPHTEHATTMAQSTKSSSSLSTKKDAKMVETKGKIDGNSKVPSTKEPTNDRKDADAIDDMFSQAIKKKRLNEQTAKAAQEEEEAREKRYKQAAIEAKREAVLFTGNPDPKIHRWDKETGLPVYKYYDLRMGEAGSGFTPLCPFDCSCCF